MAKAKKVFDDCVATAMSLPSRWATEKAARATTSIGCQTPSAFYRPVDMEVQTGLSTSFLETQVKTAQAGSRLADHLSEIDRVENWDEAIAHGFVTVDWEVVTDPDYKLHPEEIIEYVDSHRHRSVQTATSDGLDPAREEAALESASLERFLRRTVPIVFEALEENERSADGFAAYSSSLSVNRRSDFGGAADERHLQPFLWRCFAVDLEKKKVVFPDWTNARRHQGLIVGCTVTRNQERIYEIEYDDGVRLGGVKEEYIRLVEGDQRSNRRKVQQSSSAGQRSVSGSALLGRLQVGVRVHAKVTFKNGQVKHLPGRIVKISRSAGGTTAGGLYDVECEGSRVEVGLSVEDLVVGLSDGMVVEAKRPKTVLLQCTGGSWNSTGNMLAVSYGRMDVSGWCDLPGAVCCWNLLSATAAAPDDMAASSPDYVLDHSCCLLAVAFHPVVPSVLAAASFNGEVIVWDLTTPEQPAALSRIMEYAHREPVLELAWVADPQPARGDQWLLASSGGDGRLLFWSRSNRFHHPVKGFSVTKGKTSGRNKQFSQSIGVSSILFSPMSGGFGRSTFPRWLIVGQEDGAVTRHQAQRLATYEITTEMLKQLPQPDVVFPSLSQRNEAFSYHKHIGPVNRLHWSPFHRSLFLTGGSDGVIKLMHLLDRQPLLRWEPSAASSSNGGRRPFWTAFGPVSRHNVVSIVLQPSITALQFSPVRPLVFAAGSSDGFVYIFDLKQSQSGPVVAMQITPQMEAQTIVTVGESPAKGDSGDGGRRSRGRPGAGSAQRVGVTAVLFNSRRKELLTVGDCSGRVLLFKLPWSLVHAAVEEPALLEELAGLHGTDHELRAQDVTVVGALTVTDAVT